MSDTSASAHTPASDGDGAHARPVPDGAIPTVDSVCTPPLRHRFGDLFNPPGLTNFWGSAQALLDVTGVRSIAFPPFSLGELGVAPFGLSGDSATCVLYLDGEYVTARKQPVEFVWRPDRIERRALVDHLSLFSETILPFGRTGVAVRLHVTNEDTRPRRTELKLAVRGGVTKTPGPWNLPGSPGEFDNAVTVNEEAGTVLFSSRYTEAHVVQGSWPVADKVEASWLVFNLDLAPGETWSVTFALALAQRAEDAAREYRMMVRRFDSDAEHAEHEWNAELAAAFTPGNDRFSGHLPLLVTQDHAIRRLYHTALVSLLFHKRTTPVSAYGRTYITLGPRYWQTATFLWDISLSAQMLAMLDPLALRRMIETWMEVDVHEHFGTDYLTGTGIGGWYSVNDYAMCRMADQYLCWTGDFSWLDHEVGGRVVLDRLLNYAQHWRTLDVNGHGLADYGEVWNLLEAVGSYVHEVAGMNAANAYNLRFVAHLLDMRGRSDEARNLRVEADALVAKVLELYVPGEGVWCCRNPDGRLQEVRHCYDFATILCTIPQDLTPTQRSEMVRFFRRELQTETWMRALSTRDLDVTFSIRPDHQWTGAYSAWPALCLNALHQADEDERAFAWMVGIARTSLQGPIAQAHFAENVFDPEPAAGALKAPSEQPYINDWSCVSGSAFLEPVVSGLFGLRPGLDGRLGAIPRFGSFDAGAELRNVPYQGSLYVASRSGVRPAD